MTPFTLSTSVILIVDDLPANLEVLSRTLADAGAEALVALDGESALEQAAYAQPDLILLDVMMPGIDGFETCRRLKEDPKLRDIPVIFTTSLSELEDKVRGLSLGATDYITKPFQMGEVIARVRNHLHLRHLHRELQRMNQMLEDRVRQRTLALEQEIQERREAQELLFYQAHHDELTGLPNRRYILDRLQEHLHRSKQDPNFQFAVLFIDCDRFKVINDSLGHLVGDQVLIEVAIRLKSFLRTDALSLIGRLGGDEFLIILERGGAQHQVNRCAEQILKLFKQPFRIGLQQVFMDLSIGIVYSEGYTLPEDLLRDADTAMYQAKRLGRKNYQVFEPHMHTQALSQLQLETDLRQAIERQEFFLHYQPIVDLVLNQPVGVEALVRWQHPKHGLISPADFIPVAEETGLIVPIGQWVFWEACQRLRTWQELGGLLGSLTMNINLSPRQLLQPDLLPFIRKTLDECQISGAHLKLEVTETALFEQVEVAKALMQQLREMQIQICLDDFGTGYSSLSYLRRFPVSTLKVDRSFVCGIEDQTENLEIVRAIVAMSHSLGIQVVAEGVETEAQQEILRIIGCEMAQGYYFSHPLEGDKVGPWFAEQRQDGRLVSR